MTIRIIDRHRKEEILSGRLDFIRAFVESEMQLSRAPVHHDETGRILQLTRKFDEVRSRLTLDSSATDVAQGINAAIRESQRGAFKVQSSLEIKKLLDLI